MLASIPVAPRNGSVIPALAAGISLGLAQSLPPLFSGLSPSMGGG